MELRTAFRQIEFLSKTMEPPLLDGVDTVLCWLSRKIMLLRHRPHKMCEYQADAAGQLDEETLLYWLRELVQLKHVRAEERVPMGTHDFPHLEVRFNFHFSRKLMTCRMLIMQLLSSVPQVDGGLGTRLV